jgi:hypothetical protein
MVFATLWFLQVPVTVLVGLGLEPWNREKAVYGTTQLFTSLGYFSMWYLFRPMASNNTVLSPDEDKPFQNNNMQVFPEFTDLNKIG